MTGDKAHQQGAEIPLVDEHELARRASQADPLLLPVWKLLREVKDPEIPVLSIEDLGILQEISREGDQWVVTITPTYSGCPAMDQISQDIQAVLEREGYTPFRIVSRLSPAWTTDWISRRGRDKLEAYGIAPPVGRSAGLSDISPEVACPRCHSLNTRVISEFGSTACKALYQCNSCQEPFDYFKCH